MDGPTVPVSSGSTPSPDMDLQMDNPEKMFGPGVMIFKMENADGTTEYGATKVQSAEEADKLMAEIKAKGGGGEISFAAYIQTVNPDSPKMILDPENPQHQVMIVLIQQNAVEQKKLDYDTAGHIAEDTKKDDDKSTSTQGGGDGSTAVSIDPSTGEPYVQGTAGQGQKQDQGSGGGGDDKQGEGRSALLLQNKVEAKPIPAPLGDDTGGGSTTTTNNTSGASATTSTSSPAGVSATSSTSTAATASVGGPSGPGPATSSFFSGSIAVAFLNAKNEMFIAMIQNKEENQKLFNAQSDALAANVVIANISTQIEAASQVLNSEAKIAGAAVSMAASFASMGMAIRAGSQSTKAASLTKTDKEGKMVETAESKQMEAASARTSAIARATDHIGSSINTMIVSSTEMATTMTIAQAKQTAEWARMLQEIARQIMSSSRDAINSSNVQTVVDGFAQMIQKSQQAWIR